MDPNVLSTGVRSTESSVRPESDRARPSEVCRDWLTLSIGSDPPESYVRPESQRPRLFEYVRSGRDNLRLPKSSNPTDFNSRGGKHFHNKGSSEASDEGGAFQVPASYCKSNLDSTDLDKIRKNYQIPNDVVLRVPNFVDDVCYVNEGDILLYEAFFKVGLRLPFHPFIGELLRRLGLAPGQLVPNAWMIVVSWLNSWQRFDEESAEPSVDKFLYCYQLRKAPRSSSHWCFFARDNDTKLGIKLRSSNGPWKSNYFVVRGATLLEGVRSSWGKPKQFNRPILNDFHLNRLRKAFEFSTGDHNKRINTKIQSQKKAKLSILGKRKASSELSSQESSAHGVIPPVIGPTTSSAILPLPVVDGPPRPRKGKEVAITPTTDTDDASETVRSKQVLIEQDVTDDFRSMIRNLWHVVEEGTKILTKLSVMGNEDFERATAIKDVVMKKVEHVEAAERAEG